MVSRRLGAVGLGYLRVPEVSKHVVLVTILELEVGNTYIVCK